MKNILLATDFSVNAHVASLCAARISAHLGGRLVIFYVLPPFVKPKGKINKTSHMLSEEVAQKKLDKVAYEMRNQFDISVSRLLKPGFVEYEINAMAERLKAVLVIMGTHGEGNNTTEVLGGISAEVLEKSNFPLVCVPPIEMTDLKGHFSMILSKQHQFCNQPGLNFLKALDNQIGSTTTFQQKGPVEP